MNLVTNLIALGLDAGILALCCEGVFGQKSSGKTRDLLLLPILFLLFIIPRMNVIAVREKITVSIPVQGFEIVPVDGLVGLLFLIFSVLLLNSIFFSQRSSGHIFCGTMAVFSIYLFVKCLSIVFLAVCGAGDLLLLLGSRGLSLGLILLLICTPYLEQIREFVQTGDFIVWIVSANVAILLAAVLTVLSFDVDQILSHLWLIVTLLLGILLLDSVLLFFHQHRGQERKRIYMIEQYVPIVEELISQVRARQHEFSNRMLAIETAVSLADTLEEAQQEVAALAKGVSLTPNDRELLSCDSKIIAGMLFDKMKQAEAANLCIELQLHGLFKKTAVPETEWIEAMGILLDNAIEASPKGSTIYMSSRKSGDYLELLVSNPGQAMSTTEFMALFRRGVTTKSSPGDRGFGLYNILRMTERYHGKILTRNEVISGENYVVFGLLLP